MTPLDDTRHCPMCEDAAKKIRELESDRARIAENLIQALKRERELEQRVKVLTDAGNSALKYIEDLERQCGIIACSTTGELRQALNQTPQQTAAQIERGHVEWMMKLPIFGVWHQGETDAESDFFLGDVVDADYCAYCTKLVAIPPLPKESKE